MGGQRINKDFDGALEQRIVLVLSPLNVDEEPSVAGFGGRIAIQYRSFREAIYTALDQSHPLIIGD